MRENETVNKSKKDRNLDELAKHYAFMDMEFERSGKSLEYIRLKNIVKGIENSIK